MKTTSWKEIRAERTVDEQAVTAHIARFKAEERAFRLREIRKELGVTQKELAERMEITQPTISNLAAGELERSGLSTLRSYVNALGGKVEVIAVFGDRSLTLSAD